MTSPRRTTGVDWADAHPSGPTAAAGGLRSAATSWARFAIQLTAMIVVARLIGPDEYGAAAALLVAVTAAEVLRSGGITWLIAHDSALTPSAASMLHRIAVVAGLSLGAAWVIVGASPAALPLAGGRWGPFAMAAVYVMAGYSAVPTAVLVRNLRLGAVGLAEISAALASATLAIAVAATGGGASALLVQAAGYAAVLCLSIRLLSPWRPGPREPLRQMRKQLVFAANASLTQVLEWAVRSLDRVFVAVLFGQAAAGFYVQAAQLVTLPLEQVNGPLRRIAVPVLGRLQDQPERFRTAFVAVLNLASATLWPAFATCVALAAPIVEFAFGPQWSGTVPLFLAMLPAAFGLVIAGGTSVLALASGVAARQTRWDVLVNRPLLVLCFALGPVIGLQTMVLATSIVTVATAVPGFLWVAHRTPIRVTDLVGAVGAPALTALLTGATAAAIANYTAPSGWALGWAAASALVTAGVGSCCSPRLRRNARLLSRRRGSER